MRLGPLRLNRRRAMRALAGFVAAFLLTGNALAAAGLCAIKAPRAAAHAPASQAAPGAPADASDCSQHHAGHAAPAASAHHCPTDDPSAQTRTVDVPAPQVMAAMAAGPFNWHDATLRRDALVVVDHSPEPRPLYERLQRLRL